MKLIHIELTEEQKAALREHFDAVKRANLAGAPSLVIAQVWPDGMAVAHVSGRQAEALASALGGVSGLTYNSARAHIQRNKSRPKLHLVQPEV